MSYYTEYLFRTFDYDKQMSEWIKKRKQSGMTQEQVAKDIHSSKAYVSKIEHFERRSLAMYHYYKQHFGGE